MTSKEALEVIVRKHCVSNTDKEDEELEKCYKCVMSDLEVLEIIKKHQIIKNEAVYLDTKDLIRVKEWLENGN